MGVLEANELELRLALPLADAMLPIDIPGSRTQLEDLHPLGEGRVRQMAVGTGLDHAGDLLRPLLAALE